MKILPKELIKKTILLSISLIIGITFSLYLSNSITNKSSQGFLYDNVESIPSNKVGLLLGTAKYLGNGYVNLYYQNRLSAAFELYQKNKIEYILISGDNSRKDYNEPQNFKEDLVKMGVPESRIFLDYAGFRTLDSVVRSKKIFGQNKITVISQKFHNERALYISKYNKIDAIGYNAKDVPYKYGFKVKIREKLARLKMIIDLHVISKEPKYLGEEIRIP